MQVQKNISENNSGQMHVEIEEIEYCKVKAKYTADVESVKEKRNDAVKLLRKAQISGFRKGKAPDYAIKARCKNQINDYVRQEMANHALEDIKFETKIKPIGQPQVNSIMLKNNHFECEMTILKKPDFELKQYKDFEIPKPHLGFDEDEKLEALLQDFRMRLGDVEPYGDDDFVEKGDQITVDFVGTIDGEEFEGSTAEGQLYTVGEGKIPGFDDNLLGMMPDDEREFDIEIPEGHGDLGGKTVHFKVKLHMGTKRKPAALTDELAKQLGEESLDALKEQLRKVVKANIDQANSNAIRNQLTKRLLEANEFKTPEWLTITEAQLIARQNNTEWHNLNDEEREVFIKQAEDNVRLALIIDSVKEVEPESVLSEIEAQNAIKQQIKQHGQDPEKYIKEMAKTGQLAGQISGMQNEFTMQWLMKQVKLVD